MQSSGQLSVCDHYRIRAALITGLVVAALLDLVVFFAYPGPARAITRHLVFVAAGIFSLGVFAALFWFRRIRTTRLADAATLRRGVTLGCLGGMLWIVEIGFNNFLSPALSTGQARFYVDNGVWATISLSIVALAVVRAFNSGGARAGLAVGYWSGLVSGLIACLMGLLLITFCMPFLLRDPLSIGEYALRGSPVGEDFATYLAYETLAGAFGHLLVIGVVMGTLLGAVGGILGRALRLASRRWFAANVERLVR